MTAVARHWVSGRGGIETADAIDDGDPLTAAASREVVRRGARDSETLPEIGPEEIDVVRLFLNLSTQWRREAAGGSRTGIDYGVVPTVAGMLEIATTPALLADLRTMEHAALIRMAAA